MTNDEYAEIMDRSNFMIDSSNEYDMKIKESLERDVEMDVIVKGDPFGYAYNLCPVCHNWIIYEQFCPNCGQRLKQED